MLKSKKAQSTLEYITVFVIVIAAIVAFAAGALRPATERVLTNTGTRIDTASPQFPAGGYANTWQDNDTTP